MTQPSAPPASVQRFVLRSVLAFRALAIGAVGALLGAALLVLGEAMALPGAVLVVGAVLLGFALAVTVAAALADRRWRQTVLLDHSALTLLNRDRRRTIAWSDIRQVRLEGDRVVFTTGAGEQDAAEVTNPYGPSERAFTALLAAISARLDADRGYHSLEE